ncbi:MAG: hypothetical protein M3417_05735 [Actinomycetota bacterium]|nr:hypothetical protein [Actinomycetota bacterium]
MPRSRATRRVLLAVGIAALLAPGAGPAAAQDGPSVSESRLLWATVNICDTKAHPDTVGIRGSIPGSGVASEQMFMRFQLQFFDQKDKEWHNIGASGDSGFIPVGSGRFKQRQSGRNFTVRPPRTGAFILRGAVTFEWRKDGEVVRRARKRTTSKRGPTAGADPSGFSAAKCEVRA